MRGPTSIVLATVMAAVSLQSPSAQEARIAAATATERFVGTLVLRRPQARNVRVAVHNWIIRGRQRLAALELPLKGTMVVQLRGGSLTTIIGAASQKRHEGEYWIVPPGATMGIQTDDDSAVIQTLVIAE
jgi:quercetin dioxygenase-like cupin family protein